MKQLCRKSLGVALMLAAFVAMSSRAFAYRITVQPDSATATAMIGSSGYAWVNISDGRDSTQPNQQPGTVTVSLNAGSEFTMLTDSVIHFVGFTGVSIRYSPTDSNITGGTLTIRSDSTTVYVTVVGYPQVNHHTPGVILGNYDSLYFNKLTCEDLELKNSNADTLWVTGISLTDDPRPGTQWSLDNLVTLPLAVAGGGTKSLGDLCAQMSLDSGWIQGSLHITYQYGSSIDSTLIGLSGHSRPYSAECVSASSGNFGDVTAGETVTKTITLTNTSDTSIYLYNGRLNDSTYWTLNSSSFPVVLPVDSSVDVSVTLSVPGNVGPGVLSQMLYAEISGNSPDEVPCNSLSVQLWATIEIPVSDSITLEVPPGSNSFSISQRANPTRHAIFIQNSGTSQLLLESLSVAATDTGASPYFDQYGTTMRDVYDSLAPNATSGPYYMTVYTTDTGTFGLSLTLTYAVQGAEQKGATPASNSPTYTIVAHQLPPISAGVSEPNAPAPEDFTLSPNPAEGEVTIGLPQDGTSTIEIYDILGNLVLNRTAEGEFVWNGALNGAARANGTYIVRVSEGNRVSSKRLVFLR